MSENARIRDEARGLFPGGVNSPVRSFRSVGGEPIPLVSGAGSHVFDGDGNEYIDLVGAYGPLILGHSHPGVVNATISAAVDGTALGALTAREVELGTRIAGATGLERMRFVNSGTEATMTALRLARAATRRDLVVKFDGCYHGHNDALLVKAGSGVATLGLSDSAGVPGAIAQTTAVLPYNDPAALEDWFASHGAETAAVIVEPLAGNMGLVEPTPAFLEALQTIPKRHGALLIADEIITGFRLRYGLSGLLPQADIVCLGKIIGGGLPVGAFGGSAELMSLIAPEGPVYQAGTLSGNSLVMAAGIATLDQLARRTPYETAERIAARIEDGLRAAIVETEVPASIVRVGSLLTLFFQPEPPHNYEEARECDTAAFATFHHALVERGILPAPSQFEAWFISAAHDDADADAVIAASREALQIVAAGGDQ